MTNLAPKTNVMFENVLEREIIVVTTTTLVRLFEMDPNAVLLYTFYLKTAKLQANQIGYTNKIKATADYCMKGLHWGSRKYQRVKETLRANGFITDIIRKDAKGLVTGHYVELNFLMKSHSDDSIHSSRLPVMDSSTPNAVNKKLNADKHVAPLVPSSNQGGGDRAQESHSIEKPIVINPQKAIISHVAQAQGFKMLGNYGKQAKFVKLLLDGGYTVEQVQDAATRMAADDYWKEHPFDVSNVYNNIHKYEKPKVLSKEERVMEALESIDSASDVYKRLEEHES